MLTFPVGETKRRDDSENKMFEYQILFRLMNHNGKLWIGEILRESYVTKVNIEVSAPDRNPSEIIIIMNNNKNYEITVSL